jgi:hypothetical protein
MDKSKQEKKPIDLNDLFVSISLILLGIVYIIGAKTNLMNYYLIDFGEIDLETVGWGIFNLSFTFKDIILFGATLILGLIFMINSSKKEKEKEIINVYIEDPEKETQKEKAQEKEKSKEIK